MGHPHFSSSLQLCRKLLQLTGSRQASDIRDLAACGIHGFLQICGLAVHKTVHLIARKIFRNSSPSASLAQADCSRVRSAVSQSVGRVSRACS